MTTIFYCQTCKNYYGGGVCEAFQEEIPEEIIRGEVEHKKEYPGDNGIRFEFIEEEK